MAVYIWQEINTEEKMVFFGGSIEFSQEKNFVSDTFMKISNQLRGPLGLSL